MVDHRNGCGLDNRKSNLRICTSSQNQGNASKLKGKFTSRFRGVAYKPNYNRWTAEIKRFKVRHHLGTFRTEVEAALAYDKAALEHWGEFARLNFPESQRRRA